MTSVLDKLLDDLTANLPVRSGPHSTGIVPIAVFVSADAPLGSAWAERAVEGVLVGRETMCQVVRLSPGYAVRRDPFRLPFRILCDEGTTGLLQPLQQAGWYLNQDLQYGMRIQSASEMDSALRAGKPEWDIVLVRDLTPVFRASASLPMTRRPRLVVGDGKSLLGEMRFDRGTAFVLVDYGYADTDKFLRELVFGFIHDLPLHEAVKAAQRRYSAAVTVIANPISNQYLRILDALVAVKREGERLQTSLPLLAFDSMAERLSNSDEPAERQFVSAVRSYKPPPSFQAAQAWLSDVHVLPKTFADFEQESTGLVPLSGIEAGRISILAAEPELRKAASELVNEPSFATILRRHQTRTVDVAVQRIQSDPVLTAVSATETLRVNTEYQLRLHVGQRLPESVMVGPPPPLDPLLPDPEGHQGYILEIAVQGKEFRVMSKSVCSLHLPTFGGSEPVYFKIRTPKLRGKARLRICVYYRNHLLQSFILSAEIADGEVAGAEKVLAVELEFSRTDAFGNVGEFGPRSMSIGVNLSGATHELVIKSEKVKQDYTFLPSTYEPEVQQFRTELTVAVRDPVSADRPRIYPVIGPGEPPSAQVSDCIRSWARIGRKLYDSLLNKSEEAEISDALFALKQTRDKKIQVIRFDENFVFPWTLLYDFTLPEETAGGPVAPVCLGGDKDGSPCSHSFDKPIFCVNGFWGVRHYLEEMIRRVSETAINVPRQAQQSVRLVADPELAESAQLAGDLSTAIGAGQVITGPNERAQLLDLLWLDPPQRPSILIILAHMETRRIPGQPLSPRLVLKSGEWLTQESISTKRSLFPRVWQQPRPVVFLMACRSAASDVNTINDFVSAWNGCGAAAIIGTEAIVGSDMASQFALEVGKGLWSGLTLGQAVAEYRRALLKRGNVLAFVFHAIGDVDLTIN